MRLRFSFIRRNLNLSKVYVGCLNANHTCNFRNGSTFSKADCSFQDLERIPCDLGNITILNMKSNKIVDLTMGQLEELTELNKLELDNNGLKERLYNNTGIQFKGAAELSDTGFEQFNAYL